MHGSSLEFAITEYDVYCNLSLIIGDIIITKVFKNKEHRILNDIVSLLKLKKQKKTAGEVAKERWGEEPECLLLVVDTTSGETPFP